MTDDGAPVTAGEEGRVEPDGAAAGGEAGSPLGVEAGAPAPTGDRRKWRRWPAAAAREVLRRTAAGEALRSICRDPEMPGLRTVTQWIEGRRPGFREALMAARDQAGRSFVGRTSTYCQETAEILFQRLCAGEGLVRICREDPSLPSASTVYRWVAERDDFRVALALARAIAAEHFAEKGLELLEAATPETAYLTDVRLKHLRWHAGKLEPRKYGALRPQDPPAPHDEDDRNNLTVVVKRYNWDGTPVEGPEAREEVLYRMKQLPQTPAARREAERERAAERGEESRGRAPDRPGDPEGWT